MNEIENIIDSLRRSPLLLENLLTYIPEDVRKLNRIKNKWSIHEHACHIVDVQPMLVDRFILFRDEPNPVLKPYLPGKTVSDDHLKNMDLKESIKRFYGLREELLNIIKNFDSDIWNKKVKHDEYSDFTPLIQFRHVSYCTI